MRKLPEPIVTTTLKTNNAEQDQSVFIEFDQSIEQLQIKMDSISVTANPTGAFTDGYSREEALPMLELLVSEFSQLSQELYVCVTH